jgi:gliding motility-associated lipoprotein GldD
MNLRVVTKLMLASFVILVSCEAVFTPKPRGYFRIDLPDKAYKTYDSLVNYRFEHPAYARVVTDIFTADEPDWLNIEFPQFNGILHLSYKQIEGNLALYVEDSRSMLLQHMAKASGISDSLIFDDQRRMYGLLHHISGKGTASPLQFYVSDSSNHFIRGALYFNIRPNNDSMAPVIEFLKQDVHHLISTLEWK